MAHRNKTGINAFEYAYDQTNRAICSGFYLEAIVIEYAMLCEHLFGLCKDTGMRAGRKSATLRMIAHHLRANAAEQLSERCFGFLDGLDTFIARRQSCMNMLAQHGKRATEFDPVAFNKLAQCAAVEGKELVLKVICCTELHGCKKTPEV